MVRIVVPFNPLSAAQVWAYATRALTDKTGFSILLLPDIEFEIDFPSAEAVNAISATGDQYSTERTITVAIPSGASIVRVMLIAVVTAMNNTANAQKIGVTVQGRKGTGSWSNFFAQANVMGFGDIDGATCSLVPLQDVSALVDEAATYGFRICVNLSVAQSVRFTTQYVLIVTYKMS